ncbi:MAG: Type 1 glutamine amidotransferase-like domain-containing protein [Candidatus Taylorbacteria bacterium]|nr:Type 1 glutamine amidotransferase-like domain-containing protein [Candidatus Taylorbacteria bacterium]
MKLLLTSAGWWKNPEIGKEFVKLVDKKPSEIRILLVMTPVKYLKRNKYVLRMLRQFKGVNIPEENVTFFQFERKIREDDIKNIDVIFVFGGNTFEYLDGIRKTGLDKVIKSFVKNGGVYMGLSAGSYVVCPTIEAATWKHADRNQLGLKDLRGLNLVPFLISAHFDEDVRKNVAKSATKAKYPTIALTDKQAVLVNDGEASIIGGGEITVFDLTNRFKL